MMELLFTSAAGPRQRSHSRVRVPRDSRPFFTYCLRFETKQNLEGQVRLFISLTNRMTQLYPQALGSLLVTFYDSQGYGGGILMAAGPRYIYISSARTAYKTPSSIVAFVSVGMTT
jgi:hypothetical protein